MAERIRTVTVTVEVDTNKQTHKRQIAWDDNETRETFERRAEQWVVETIKELTELS